MGLNILTLGSGKAYANQVALGICNMYVEGTTVYFTIKETGEEVSVTLPTPADGVSIENVELNPDNTFSCFMSNGEVVITTPLNIVSIIDVTTLPTENINENAFYRMSNVLYLYNEGHWISYETIGRRGNGVSAEVFNHQNNTAIGSYSHAEGNSDGNANDYLTVNKNLLNTGDIAKDTKTHIDIITKWQTAASKSEAFTLSTGKAAHIEGNSNLALGDNSHAEGRKTISQGKHSHAQNYNTQALGESSMAMGADTIAYNKTSVAEGFMTTAGSEKIASDIDNPAHAEGFQTHATGYAAHTEGQFNTAEGAAAHAEGSSTFAKADFTHVEGIGAKAYDKASHAEGAGSIAGKKPTSSGGTGEDSGDSNEDDNTPIEGIDGICASHAEGIETIATGRGSHTEGQYTQATEESGHAEGLHTFNHGIAGHTEGAYTIVGELEISGENAGEHKGNTGNYSHAEGFNNKVIGEKSHVEGEGNISRGDCQHVQGKYNQYKDKDGNTLDYAHVVGGGTSDNDRKNIHTIDWKGTAWFAKEIKVGGQGEFDPTAEVLITKAEAQKMIDEAIAKLKDELNLA